MTSTIIPGLLQLKGYEKLQVIDVGCARGSFLRELFNIVSDEIVTSIGIDPLLNGEGLHTKYIKACVDNVDSPKKVRILTTGDDQASTICTPKYDGFKDGGQEVDVLNLNDIILEEMPEGQIHFLKIDAEGKDYSILESLTDETLDRILFIAVECINGDTRFKEERNKIEVIEYLGSKGFGVFYSHDTNNGSGISDVIFRTTKDL